MGYKRFRRHNITLNPFVFFNKYKYFFFYDNFFLIYLYFCSIYIKQTGLLYRQISKWGRHWFRLLDVRGIVACRGEGPLKNFQNNKRKQRISFSSLIVLLTGYNSNPLVDWCSDANRGRNFEFDVLLKFCKKDIVEVKTWLGVHFPWNSYTT